MNIHKGFSIFNRRFTLPKLREVLSESDFDIVFLQEAVGENLRLEKEISAWPKTTQSEFLAGTRFPHQVYGRNANYDQRHHGNAILSRFPILSAENIPISTYKFEQRGLLHCSVDVPGLPAPLHLFNVHLDLTEVSRKRQIQKIIQRAKSHVPAESALILAGDFNDWSRKVSGIISEALLLIEASKTHHGDYQKSFPSFFPVLKLDRVYFRHLKIISVQALSQDPWPGFSDHLPILIEFELD